MAGNDGYAWTAPVGKFRPNAFGLHDTHGNVWEWCADRYDENYYANSPPDDPPGPREGDARVARGGGYSDFIVDLRTANRYSAPPMHRNNHLGFRVVRER